MDAQGVGGGTGEIGEDERSEASPISPSGRPLGVPDPEVRSGRRRRRFSAEYKRKVLRLADACKGAGEIGALLRREGLYSSHLSHWRQMSERGELAGLSARKRGRKSAPEQQVAGEMDRLRRENERLRTELHKAEIIITVRNYSPP